MSTNEETHVEITKAPEPDVRISIDSSEGATGVTAHAIPKSASQPTTTATFAHAVPASPTTAAAAATATPIPTMPQPATDVAQSPTRTQETDNTPILPPRETHEDLPNPRTASLSAIFPNFDSALLESVLDSVDGNEERACDILLGMSDPNYVSQVQPAQRGAQLSQTELDEQLAHRLMLEEQQQSNTNQQGTRSRTSQAETQQPGGRGTDQSGDAMDRFFDQVDKFAETSKKSLSNFFQKVKAKVDEFDSNRQNAANRITPQNQEQWQGQSRAYYAPPAQQQSAPSSMAAQGHDIQSPPASAPRSPEPDLQPPSQRRSPTTTPPPTNTIDPSKLGMLPKRPVSLLGPQTPPPRPPSPRGNEDDELDYVENPFEEGRHR